MKKFKDKRGFTLVEVLVVVAIIGILSAISTPILVQNIDKAKVTRIIAKYDAFKKATISNMTSSEIKLDEELIKTITNEVNSVPDITPIGGKYLLTTLENADVKCIDENGNILNNTTISWQVALGIVNSDNDIYMTDKQFKQLVKSLGNTNIVVKDGGIDDGIYIKIVD